MSRKPVLVAVLALVLAPTLLLAAPRPTPEQILHNPRLLARYLQLTPDQVSKAQPLFQALGNTLKSLRDQEEPLAQQLKTLLEGSNPSACDVGALVVQINGLHDQARAAAQTFDQAFSALLTPEQLAKYNALKDAAHLGDPPSSNS
jgi:Spy/CpxP family protein refolding chaperone